MKILKVWAVISIAATSTFAATQTGVFVGAELGRARLKNDDFKVYNQVASPSPETLPSLDTTNNVGVARLTVGYAFNQEWDLRLSYTRFGEAEIAVTAPSYPGIVFAIAPDSYPRNVVKYQTSMVTVLPVYTISATDRLRFNGGIGFNYATTNSHFETVRYQNLTGTRADSFAEDSESDLSLVFQFGVEYFVIKNLSLQATANYSEATAKVPPSSMWGRGAGATFKIKATSVQFAAAWHF